MNLTVLYNWNKNSLNEVRRILPDDPNCYVRLNSEKFQNFNVWASLVILGENHKNDYLVEKPGFNEFDLYIIL